MKTIIIIPARYQSTRFPGKPLVKIRGTECVLRTWNVATQISGLNGIYVATDDDRIAKRCQEDCVSVIMTSRHCLNGTERVAEAIRELDVEDNDIIINLQGDAPLTPPWFIESIIETFRLYPESLVVTPVIRCDEESYQRLISDRKQGRVGGTTVVSDSQGRAIYFSKEVLPHLSRISATTVNTVFHHAGVYGYRVKSLRQYSQWGAGVLEGAEQLEQLRFIENAVPVRITEVDTRGKAFWELNNPEDTAIIESMLICNGD